MQNASFASLIAVPLAINKGRKSGFGRNTRALGIPRNTGEAPIIGPDREFRDQYARVRNSRSNTRCEFRPQYARALAREEFPRNTRSAREDWLMYIRKCQGCMTGNDRVAARGRSSFCMP